MNRYSTARFFKKSVAAAAVSLSLVSCTDPGSGSDSTSSSAELDSPQITFRAFEDAEPGLPFEGEIGFVTGTEDDTSINDRIYDLIFDDYQAVHESCSNIAVGDTVGNYSINREASTALANQTFASVILQVEASCAGGRISTSWISFATAIDPTVEIFFTDLLDASQSKAHDIIALIILGIDNTPNCVGEFTDSLQQRLSDDDFTAWNSVFEFAVTTDGVMLGFNQGSMAATACGAGSAVIPWATLEGRLSEFGEQLRGSIE
ncbi:hypothetical protein [Glycomyces tritici]|uniref:DUF3298 domain-containing protein n=1 Tax=Glycomyces tritici TaxID=2665176 RepID=A0ABT7YXP7_9ACTN|nr:hypothetical protein [Glycomyces tritici]MDN3243412.1 hypothetical protein [Glycomyces tritici]